MPADALLRAEGFTKRFGRVLALEDASFSMRSGEILGLLGPNGSGKTTLFECVAGLEPSQGTLYHAGQPIDVRERSRLLFYLPDAITPWPEQRVRWAIDFVTGYFGGRPELQSDIIRQLQLDPLLDSPLGVLSKGQRKRVLLALGLLTPQPVLFADEPFDGLDLRQTTEVASFLRTCAAAGRTLVLSIHQIVDAARVCDRFVLLSGGRVRGEGTLSELQSLASANSPQIPPDLEKVFLALT